MISTDVSEIFMSANVMKIFPNPATSEINISIEGEDLNDYTISILNVLDEEQKIDNSNSVISVEKLASGIYFISAIHKEGKSRLVTKFIKE